IAVATIVTTVIIVMFGEIAPKSLAAQGAERWSLAVGRIIEVVMRLETWIIFLFTLPPRLVLWLMGGRKVFQTPSVTEGELRMLVGIGRAEGMLEHSEAQLIENVFRFGDRQVREVMTPRTEVVALERGVTLEEFLRLYQQHAHTRFPVYEGSMDNVLGTVSVKDVVQAMAAGSLRSQDDVTQLLRPAYFVPETKLIGDLFRELKGTGYQLVIAADEYGGVAGLATLKQMVEEVVGRVGEEGVSAEEDFQVIDARTYQVDAGMDVEEANTRLALGIPEGNYETVAGFLLTRLGHIPKVGEHLYHNGFLVEIVEMRGVKIEQVKVTRVARSSPGNGQ
ncbi:MAG: hemolysin family protein, partial [Chloroflexota bacterium]